MVNLGKYGERTIVGILVVVGFTIFLTTVLFPFYWMIISSMKNMGELFAWPPKLVPSELDFSAYWAVLFQHGFLNYMKNSAIVTLSTVLLTISLGTLGAYAVSRLYFKGKNMMQRSILLIYMFPPIVLVIPLYVLMSALGLRDSLGGLVLVYLAQTLPVSLYMLSSYFKQLPPDLEEAGLVDGCNRLEVIWRITIPLSVPAIMSVALYTFMIAWNEFLFAFMFLDSTGKFTLPIGMTHLFSSYHTAWDKVMAAGMIITIPVVIVFLVFERYMIRGLTAGSIKG